MVLYYSITVSMHETGVLQQLKLLCYKGMGTLLRTLGVNVAVHLTKIFVKEIALSLCIATIYLW